MLIQVVSEVIAAVSGPVACGGGSGFKRAGNKNKFSGRGRGGHKQPPKQPNQTGKPDQAGMFGQVCYIHLRYGSKAYSCVDSNTCAWAGNEQAGERSTPSPRQLQPV